MKFDETYESKDVLYTSDEQTNEENQKLGHQILVAFAELLSLRKIKVAFRVC
jgi:hypothetical protein